jgi:hypothetical protein
MFAEIDLRGPVINAQYAPDMPFHPDRNVGKGLDHVSGFYLEVDLAAFLADDRLSGFNDLVDKFIGNGDSVGHRPAALSFLARAQDDVAGSVLEHVDARVFGAGQIRGGFHDLTQEEIRLAGLGDGAADIEQRPKFFIAAAQLLDIGAEFIHALPLARLHGGLAEGIQDGLDDIVGLAGLEEEIFDAEPE